MQNKPNHSRVGAFIWITAFILSNFRGTFIWDVLQQGFQLAALPWIEVAVWIMLLVAALRSLIKDSLIADYLQLWRQNWILVIFIAVAFLSLLWSIYFPASLYRSAALLFSSLIGAYLGTRYSLQDMLGILFKFGILLLMICVALALLPPFAGAMNWEPYNGAWRGVFWHKNQLGSLAAFFSLVFLIRALDELEKKAGRPILYFVAYSFALVVTYFSESVAGYLLCITLGFCTLLAFFWLKTRHRLRAIHYYGALGFGVVMAVILLLNLDFIFGLFNRNTSLTGRIPLWDYLIREVIARSPWIGHGFGAVWSMNSFRISAQQVLGWRYPVAIADNGFLDILLHVGLLGLVPFLGILITLLVRSVEFAFRHLSITGFFPVLLVVFAVMANISFSLFLETETFVWLVMVAILFIVTKPQSLARAS